METATNNWAGLADIRTDRWSDGHKVKLYTLYGESINGRGGVI